VSECKPLNRGDVHAHDEPLYAHYLLKTGAARPYRAEVLEVASGTHSGEYTRPLLSST
jgi:hypothetical protein